MFARRVHSLSLVLSLGTALAVACGGPNDGHVNIVDADGGSAGSGATGGNGDGEAGESSQGGDGAGGDGEVPVLPTPPEVVSVTPSGNDLAEPTGSIEIEFSEGLDPETVTPESIQLLDGEVAVSGTLEYSGVTVTFIPDERLDLLGSYVVTVTTDVTDGGGTAMEEPYEATFQVRDGVWGEEQVVENPLDTGYLNPQLITPVIDARGNALVVWVQAKSTEPGMDQLNVWGRFFHPGEGWTDAFEIDESEGDCAGASVAMGPDGDAVVAWEQYEDGAPQVVARRYVDGDWDTAERLDVVVTTPTGGFVVTTAVSPKGEAHVFWNFNDGMYVNLHGAYAAGDEPWSEPYPIGVNYYLSPPAVAFDPDGNGFAFFVARSNQSGDEGYLYGARYIGSSQSWNNGETIPDSNDATFNGVSAVADDEGGAHALFVRFNTTTSKYDVAETHFSKAEGFSSAVGIDSLDSGPASVPRVSTNGSDRVASWSQFASSTENAYSALSDGEGYLGQELRSDGDYSVEYGDVVSGLDRRGNGVLLFAQIGSATDNQDIGILFSRLAGGEWTEAVRINQKEAQYQDARVAVAANGVAVAAWSIGTRQTANSILVSVFE